MSQTVQEIATTLVASGKGILAADETVPTLTKRFDALGISSTEESRRTYREMLFTVPGASEFISGVIMQDETIRQKGSAGTPLAHVLAGQDILPGIKVDKGAKSLAGSPTETITEGLDGSARSPRGVPRPRSAVREVAARASNYRCIAEPHVHRCKCSRPRALRRAMP